MSTPDLILASSSPRRRELLEQIGVRFIVRPSEIPEVPGALELPEDYVRRIALEKARAVQKLSGDDALPILSADTEVVLDGEIFGKPTDALHAEAMLKKLSGREHFVLSAVSLVHGDLHHEALSMTQVRFRSLNPNEIAAYWETGEPMGKAGAYAIQGMGSLFIERLSGSFSGVMGLPLHETAQVLKKVGIDPLLRPANLLPA
jgi:septum formation protein